LQVKNAKHPVQMRTGSSSDRDVLWQIFLDEQYAPIELKTEATIIDLGANVGYSSAYFLSRFPSAKVIAVEPDPKNFSICSENLEVFGSRAVLIHGAVWPKKQLLAVRRGTFRDGREWATQVCPLTAGETTDSVVQGYDMESLLELASSPEIDLLKVDIERAERELFSADTAPWLPKIRNICIELHDEECSSLFFSALSEYAFESRKCGEITVCSNLRPQTISPHFTKQPRVGGLQA